MEYKIIKVYGYPETENLEMEMEDVVNVYIDNGWEPLGPICVFNIGIPENHEKNFVEVWQPMIKNFNNENVNE